MLKSYQRMGCFPKRVEIPDMVVDFVRRAVDLPEGTLPFYASEKTAKNHRMLVRQRVGVRYDGKWARELAWEAIRSEAASKNNPADLINVALEKLVEAGLELPAFSTPDHMASTVRAGWRTPGSAPASGSARARTGARVCCGCWTSRSWCRVRNRRSTGLSSTPSGRPGHTSNV